MQDQTNSPMTAPKSPVGEAAEHPSRWQAIFRSIRSWLIATDDSDGKAVDIRESIDWVRAIPFFAIHLACVLVYFVGWSWLAIGIAVFLYGLRMFTISGFYHRYFSHRTFKTWRIVQFAFAVIGCTSAQRGPLWWAAHHRHHHAHSDDPDDLHSPKQKGILWAHMMWIVTPRAQRTNLEMIPDFAKYPELRFLDRWDLLPAFVLAVLLYGFGELVAWGAPESNVTGWQLLVWGTFVSTVFLYHVTFMVNSAAHLVGRRRYETTDDSRNSMIIALFTFGEGWHNNHHHYPNSTRQGFFWWEIDLSYYLLKVMSMLHLVWDLKPVPARAMYPQPKGIEEPELSSAIAIGGQEAAK